MESAAASGSVKEDSCSLYMRRIGFSTRAPIVLKAKGMLHWCIRSVEQSLRRRFRSSDEVLSKLGSPLCASAYAYWVAKSRLRIYITTTWKRTE